jgi:hypothetical protein
MARRTFFIKPAFLRSDMHRVSGLLHPFLYDHFIFVTVKLFSASPAGGTRLTSLAVALARMGQE